MFRPEVANKINYSLYDAIQPRRFIIMIMTIVFLFIGGLIFENANDSMRQSQGIVGRVLSAIFLFAFFAGAGYTADSNFNNELRIPLIAMDEKLEFVNIVEIGTLSEYQQRLLRRYTNLEVDLNAGVIKNKTQNKEVKITPLPKTMQTLLNDGGLVEHFKKHGGFKV